MLAPVPEESAPATKARLPPFSTMLLAPKGVLLVSVLRNSPAPSFVRVKLGLAMAVAKAIRPPEATPMVELLPRVTAPVIVPPVAAVVWVSAPRLLMPVPLMVMPSTVSAPVCCQSSAPPEFTVMELPVLMMLFVPLPVVCRVPPLPTVILPLSQPTVVPELAILNVPAFTANVPDPVVRKAVRANMPAPVLVRLPVITIWAVP